MATPQSTPVEQVEYRDVPGFPGYRVGNDGSVWSCWKSVPVRGVGNKGKWRGVMTGEWHRLKPHALNSGYRGILALPLGRRKRRWFLVHRAVLEAFVGPCPDGMQACHFPDRDPGNNRLDNLRWDTRKANSADAIIHGTIRRGERHGRVKLTTEIVRQIRAEFASGGWTKRGLARRYGVVPKTIANIVFRRQWKHV